MKPVRLATLGLARDEHVCPFARHVRQRLSGGVLRGDEIPATMPESYADRWRVFLEGGRHRAFDVVPLLFAMTNPIGTITSDAFERIVGEMLDLLRQHGPWDGVLLANHGAAVSEAYPGCRRRDCRAVRALVGPDVPIGLSPDMHANLSQQMIDNATVTVVYRTNPHLDPRPRARECAELIVRTIRGEIHPVQALEMPPVAINIVKQFTGEEPMRGLVQDVEEVMARPGMLSASVAEGYPYADVAEMGMSFLAVHDGDAAAARDAARWMARRAWDRRAEFVGDTPSPDEALRAAAAARGPVVLMDVGDNIGGGSPGDSTVLLEAAQRLGVRRFLQTLCDPQAVAACVAAGVGQTVELKVGAKTDDQHGRPVAVQGRVRVISDGRFEEPTPTHGGFRFFDGGTTVVLETTDEHTLVLTSRLVGNTSIQQMYSVGVRPEAFQVVVAKGVVSPRPAYAPIAAEIVLVNTPGVTTSDLSQFEYARIGGGQCTRSKADASTEEVVLPERPVPTKAEVESYLRDRRNWGRWGADDQVGAVNLITAEKRLRAAALVRSGRTVSLSREFPKTPAPNNPTPAQHFMHTFDRGTGGAALDYYGISYHGQASTHLDSLCHVWNDGMWNGRPRRRDPLQRRVLARSPTGRAASSRVACCSTSPGFEVCRL